VLIGVAGRRPHAHARWWERDRAPQRRDDAHNETDLGATSTRIRSPLLSSISIAPAMPVAAWRGADPTLPPLSGGDCSFAISTGCNHQRLGSPLPKAAVRDQAFRHRLATAEELTGLRDRVAGLARFCNELHFPALVQRLSTFRPCYDFNPTVHPSSAQAYDYEYA